MKIDPAKLLAGLPSYAKVKRFLVAYSGGMDSHVLLHALAHSRQQLDNKHLEAVHINHGLSANAQSWQQHCASQCERLDVSFKVISVSAKPEVGESPEAAARAARYQAFAELIEAGDCLLTAHHQDDQAETLLLQLLRGAGPKGLSGMPLSASFHDGWHVRPLLELSRKNLQAYAVQHALEWIEDESNSDTGFDRNFIRHEIMTRLTQRYPAAVETISRSARLCAEAALLLEQQAIKDLDSMPCEEGRFPLDRLKSMGEVRSRNILHYWLHRHDYPLPSALQLQHVWNDVVLSEDDSVPLVIWPGVEVRKFRGELYIDRSRMAFDAQSVIDWSMSEDLDIDGIGMLSVRHAVGNGLSCIYLNGKSLQVRFRQGGEIIRPQGRNEHHSLKKLFQEAGVPAWERDRIPLIFADDTLVAVTGLWIAHEAAAAKDEEGKLLVLQAKPK